MLITRIELENIKSYRHLHVDFRRGTTAISGANGAGKTTIVEAIGFALFDFMPYNQNQFVREGEKYGKVVVHLVGGDERPYIVERRCGSGSRWFIYDCEADSQQEQRADVMDKLHELAGIDRERSLEALFRDALGVPQGSFTAIFTETASKRKQTFDALLQIEDYNTAFKYLLDAQNQYKEQIQTQKDEIHRLEFETRDVESWRTDLAETRQKYQHTTEQMTQDAHQLELYEQRETVLQEQQKALTKAQQQYETWESRLKSNQDRMQDRERELYNARTAQTAIETNRANYHRYQHTNEALKQLRQDEKLRNELRKQQSQHASTLATIQTKLDYLHKRLEEVAQARQRIVDLSPLVDKQSELERQREELTYTYKEYQTLLEEGKSLAKQQKDYKKKQDVISQTIATIEPLQAAAALLNERVETLANVRAQGHERQSKNLQLQEKREQLRLKQEERDRFATRLRKTEKTIETIEAHRAEAETLPELQDSYIQLSEQRYRLEGNIEGYKTSRQQSIGGQCPFLKEPCLNIKGRGVISLESYFDGLLEKDHRRLAGICEQQETISGSIASLKKYADALNTLGQYISQRDNDADHLKRLAGEIIRLEREVTDLTEEVEALKTIAKQLVTAEAARNESQKADQEVKKLDGLRMQIEQLQEQIEQWEESLQELRMHEKELRGSGEQLEAVKSELEALNDPRATTRAQLAIISQEKTYQQDVQKEQQSKQAVEEQLHILGQQLAIHEQLDRQIIEHELILQQSLQGYQTYLANEQNAALLPQRQEAYQEIRVEVEKAQQSLQEAEGIYQQAKLAFHEDELKHVTDEIRRLRGEQRELGQVIRRMQQDINKLELDIKRGEERLVELETARKEQDTLEGLQTMMEQFRKYIKEAAPFVLQAILGDISAEANRIFGEIMGDRAAQLSWQNDYEIILRRQGVNRTFAQLSGGEQMSAALAIRLALLKKLSTLNIAFFDEPTQNMDELRRMNLAEQIRRVRGFDQLIVISHDDTFEQGLDSLIRLRKESGETRLVSEDEWMSDKPNRGDEREPFKGRLLERPSYP